MSPAKTRCNAPEVSSFIFHNISGDLPNNVRVTAFSNETPARTERLIEAVLKGLEMNGDVLTKTPAEAVGLMSHANKEDPREGDASMSNFKKKLPQDYYTLRLRRVLSSRSMGMEFDSWEMSTFHSSRLEELKEDPTRARSMRSDHLRLFLDQHQRLPDDEGVARGVRMGIKLLLLEYFSKSHGIAALLIFAHSEVQRLRHGDVPDFIQELRQPANDYLGEMAKEKSEWLEECQNIYDCELFSRNLRRDWY